MKRILVIYPETSFAKVAVYDDDEEILKKSVNHQAKEQKGFRGLYAQPEYWFKAIWDSLAESGISLNTLDAVVGRGVLLKGMPGGKDIPSGTYEINERMVEDLKKAELGQNASNLGGVIAYCFGKKLGIPAFIVDPMSVDELIPETSICNSLTEISLMSMSHIPNMRAIAHKVSVDIGRKYSECNMIVAHLSSECPVTSHSGGRIVDMANGYKGPVSPMYGFKTGDVRRVEKMVAEGNERARLLLGNFIRRVSMEIVAQATVVSGKVDQIILTGELANSQRIVAGITAKVRFVAPVTVVPEEEELEALAAGGLRVLSGEETVSEYR